MGNLYCQDNAAYRQFIGANMASLVDRSLTLNTSVADAIAIVSTIPNLDAGNIASGEVLLGITGTYTNEAVNAATALDIAEGKIAYVNGTKIIGVAGIVEYALTISNGGTGTGSVTVDGNAYAAPVDYVAGAEVELIATPDAGSVFVNWTVDGVEVSDKPTFTYTMPKSAKTVVANFDLE